ncbi:hypothetical protein [Virgibacillus doumboii]|uniref:hypothetical protein n=1 Tax=Virgibacillus doumboii TaxID=2697503 RepID=UPI0013DFDC4D|nr:hypothetical protein [Virgibacillus doumboii]
MIPMKNEMYYLDLTEMIPELDVEVVTNTPFPDGAVERLYGVDNHRIDYNLINILGLGVVKIKHSDDWYIYDAMSENFLSEFIKFRIYYQLSHPEFDDKELERWIFSDVTGINYVLRLIGSHGTWIISRLKEIFNGKKGRVVVFPVQ